jgi:hypothetical protein
MIEILNLRQARMQKALFEVDEKILQFEDEYKIVRKQM